MLKTGPEELLARHLMRSAFYRSQSERGLDPYDGMPHTINVEAYPWPTEVPVTREHLLKAYDKLVTSVTKEMVESPELDNPQA